MLVLAIDTATAATSVAVVELDVPGADVPGADVAGSDRAAGVVTRARRQYVSARAHGEQLAPQLGAALAEARVRPADLAAIVAGTGPGPFTGLRVGLVTAAAMGQALGIPTYGVCSLDGVGAAVAGPALVATDARRREVYWAIYAGGRRLAGPAVDRPADLLAALAAHGVGRAYGEGALRYRAEFGVPVAEEPCYPDPSVLAAVARERLAAGAPGEQLTPRYLRRPDAAEPRPPKPVTPG